MDNQAIATELLKVAESLTSAFVDQPVTFDKDTDDKLERVRADALEKLGKEFDVVKNRYYWSPGKSVMINMTLKGRPIFLEYTLGNRFSTYYEKGVLTVSPQWSDRGRSLPELPPSYKWGFIVDKMIRFVKQSEKIDKKMDNELDNIEQDIGKIDSGIRKDIINWCIKAAKRRLSAKALSPKGKEFVIRPPNLPPYSGPPPEAHAGKHSDEPSTLPYRPSVDDGGLDR